MDKKNIVIDLDGTLYTCNTFHKWMKFSFIEQIKTFDFIYPTKIGFYAVLRLLKKIEHSHMKFLILKESEKIVNNIYINKFVDSLSPYLNKKIYDILLENNHTYILATAAPKLYCEMIATKFSFNYVVSTETTNNKRWEENIREEKKMNVLLLLQNNNLGNEIYELYTDHHDDLPLMKCSRLTYLTNPSEKTKTLVKESQVNHKVL